MSERKPQKSKQFIEVVQLKIKDRMLNIDFIIKLEAEEILYGSAKGVTLGIGGCIN